MLKSYKILDTEANKSFKPEMIGQIFEGELIGEYVKVNDTMFLATEVIEFKEVKKRITTNKTKVINSIQCEGLDPVYKNEIMSIKRKLRQITNNDTESLEYNYKKIIQLVYASGVGNISGIVLGYLKQACKLIINSNVNIDCWELDSVKSWIDKGIC